MSNVPPPHDEKLPPAARGVVRETLDAWRQYRRHKATARAHRALPGGCPENAPLGESDLQCAYCDVAGWSLADVKIDLGVKLWDNLTPDQVKRLDVAIGRADA